ncbi:MAG TPA: hypothetical protein VE913_14350 [Longimicrobium sp.]|nr:hypothetical protein [Longimicrobium sp.]
MSEVDESPNRLHGRPSKIVELSMPVDVVARLRELAAARDMSPEALLKFYIGQGMRPSSATPPHRFLETTAVVLAQHIPSDEQRAAILRDLSGATTE